MSAAISDKLIDFGTDHLTDFHGVLRSLRANGAYAPALFHGMPAFIILANELVGAAFKDEETFPAKALYGLMTEPVMGKTLQCMTGDEHRMNRALVSPEFRRALMKTYSAELLEPIAHNLVDGFADDETADLVGQFTHLFPFLVTNELLGLPVEDYPSFARWAHDLFFYPTDPESAMRASAAFTEYLAPLVAEKRRAPGDDLLSKLVTVEVDGVGLSDEEIYSFVRLLFPAGVDTTYLSMGNMLSSLLIHPEQLASLRNNPGEVKWAVQEALRWEPGPVIVPRLATTDVTWHGIDIKAGTWLLLAISAANRDPDVFDDPDRFDISRHASAPLSFGSGPHVCLGMALATTQMEVALRVLLERFSELELIDPDSVKITGKLGTELRGPDRLDVRFEPADQD
ncbi:cytochrome P450 [Mycobacterium sp. DBP42]|uniref:cytochrome P450 n=1 Tax=Mycobacterium sp. DBP42 TaxID=2545267 RepID=UPI00110D160A|nr:cytochrome P450 [Mycobacterium sp. DBP42]TMS52134.1 cytochrome P450 [Mycobacterium sp. DBP42]